MNLVWPSNGDVLNWIILAIVYPFFIAIYYLKPTTPEGLTFTTKGNHEKIKRYKENTLFGEDTDYGERSVADGKTSHFLYSPCNSVRRARKMGMIRLLLFWAKTYLYVQKHGVIYKGDKFDYPYGNYK